MELPLLGPLIFLRDLLKILAALAFGKITFRWVLTLGAGWQMLVVAMARAAMFAPLISSNCVLVMGTVLL